MSAGIKISNGDLSFDPKSRRVDLIFDEEKAVQLAIHTVSFNTRVDGKGAGLLEEVGETSNSILLAGRVSSAIESAFEIVIRDQYNTPQVLKTQNELITEIRDLSVLRNEEDPRNYDIEMTVVLLSGEVTSISGILS